MTILNQPDRDLSLASEPSTDVLKWIIIQDGDVQWKVHPDYAQLFFENNQFRFEEWKISDCLDVIKSGPHRTVYRVQLEEQGVYLKHYKTPDWKSKFQNIVRPSKSMLEWNVEKQMTSFGIPTIETVAIGQKIKYGKVSDNFLISREITQTETLQDFVERFTKPDSPPMEFELRKHLAIQLGHIIGKLHCGFFDHHDLHCGNILVQVDPAFGIRLWIIDLHAIRCNKKLSQNWMHSNLALFNNYFARLISNTDRRRFFKHYWRTIQSYFSNDDQIQNAFKNVTTKHQIRSFENHCNNALQKRFQKDDRKWERNHRKLTLFDSKPLKYRALSILGKDLIASLVDDPDQLLSDSNRSFWIKNETNFKEAIISLKINDKTKSFRLQHLTTNSQNNTNRDSSSESLKNAWNYGQRIFRRSIDSVQPQVWIEKTNEKETRSWLLLEHDKEMIPLKFFLKDIFPSLNQQEQNQWIKNYQQKLIKNLQWLKTCGFTHQSLSGESLLVHSDPHKTKLQFTQHEALVQSNKVTYQQEIESFARLNHFVNQNNSIRFTQRYRFLIQYLEGNNKSTIRKQWNDIRNKTSHS